MKEHFYAGAHILDVLRIIHWEGFRFGQDEQPPVVHIPSAEEVRANIAPLIDDLMKLNTLVTSHGAKLVVMIVPLQNGDDGAYIQSRLPYDDYVLAFCAEQHLTCHTVKPTFDAYKGDPLDLVLGKGDSHWSRIGHALAGQDMAAYLSDSGLLSAPRSAQIE